MLHSKTLNHNKANPQQSTPKTDHNTKPNNKQPKPKTTNKQKPTCLPRLTGRLTPDGGRPRPPKPASLKREHRLRPPDQLHRWAGVAWPDFRKRGGQRTARATQNGRNISKDMLRQKANDKRCQKQDGRATCTSQGLSSQTGKVSICNRLITMAGTRDNTRQQEQG